MNIQKLNIEEITCEAADFRAALKAVVKRESSRASVVETRTHVGDLLHIASQDPQTIIERGIVQIAREFDIPTSDPDLGNALLSRMKGTEEVSIYHQLARRIEEIMRKSKRIWIADDLDLIPKSLRRILKEMGYTEEKISTFRTGSDLFNRYAEAIRNGEGVPDLVVSDLSMPEGNGKWLSKKLQEQGVPVVIMSSSVGDSDAKELQDNGVLEIIMKTSKDGSIMHDVADRIDQILKAQPVFPRQQAA